MTINFPDFITHMKLCIAWYQVHTVRGYLSYRSVHGYTGAAQTRRAGFVQCCMTATTTEDVFKVSTYFHSLYSN